MYDISEQTPLTELSLEQLEGAEGGVAFLALLATPLGAAVVKGVVGIAAATLTYAAIDAAVEAIF